MSYTDVAEVFYPIEKSRADLYEKQLRGTERALLALRRRLRAIDDTLPDIYDGAGWHVLEEEWS